MTLPRLQDGFAGRMRIGLTRRLAILGMGTPHAVSPVRDRVNYAVSKFELIVDTSLA